MLRERSGEQVLRGAAPLLGAGVGNMASDAAEPTLLTANCETIWRRCVAAVSWSVRSICIRAILHGDVNHFSRV